MFREHFKMQAILLLVVILAASGLVNVVGSSVLVADLAMTRMVELNAAAPFCALHHDRGVIQRMVLGSDPKKVRQISNNLVADLEETCKASRSKGKNQSPGGGIMYPGTKWCGPGNIAKSYDDLGHHAVEDACCREHDHCSKTIGPRQCIHGICNSSPFTRSHCDCDAKFRRCLQTINTEVANTLGALFFNVIQVTCFKERRPCSQWQRYLWSQPVRALRGDIRPLIIPFASTEYSQRSFLVASSRLWNDLPAALRGLPLLELFKSASFSHFLSLERGPLPS